MPIRLPSFEAILLSTLLALLAAIASWFSAPLALNNVAHDAFQRAALGEAPDDVLIVGIDEASLQGIGKWPWRRDIHAQLINRLDKAGVKAIAYDIVFSERDTPNPQYDEQLVSAVRNYGRLVSPVFVGEHRPDGQLLEVIPFDTLAEVAELGHAHIEIDQDGVLRSTHMKEGLGSAYWEHMTVVLHRLAYGEVPSPLPGARSTIQESPLEDDSSKLIVRDYRNQIRFAAPPGGFRMLSFIDVLDGRYPSGQLQDKIVFVGTMAAGLSDTLATPVSDDNRHMQGVELNANIFDALRNDRLITPLTASQRAAVTFVLSLLALFMITSAAPGFSLLTTVVFAGATLAISLLALSSYNIWWPPMASFLAITLGYPLWSWYRLDRSMRYLREELLSFNQEGSLLDHELLEDTLKPWESDDKEVPKRNIDVVAFHIDQIRRSQTSRRQLRHFIFSCLANLSDGVVATTKGGKVILINDQARRLLHLETDSAHEQHFVALLENNIKVANTVDADEQPFANLEKAVNSVLVHGEETEFEYISRFGNDVLLQGNEFTLADEHDRIVVFTMTDITRLREMERTRAETLNFVSHDLRSPLVSILALIDRSGRAVNEELQSIRSYAQRALSYTESFLQLARAEADNIALYECDLHSVADNAAEYVYALAMRKKIRITSQHCDQDVWIWGNGDLLERMIINLLDNAIKYSAEGTTVELSIETELSGTESYAVLSVSDEGIGIPEKDIPHLFEQFHRGSSDESRRRTGAGLGLRFISVTVQRHNGRISVDSTQGQGSVFTVRLPLHELEESDLS